MCVKAESQAGRVETLDAVFSGAKTPSERL
jgi:hypothetical protein